jgi:mRNA interferase YafQ
MRRVFATPRFQKRLSTFLSPTVDEVMLLIEQNPATPALRTHRLKGAFTGCSVSRLSRDYRIVFVLTADRVTFIDIGTHDDVYR